MSDEEKRRTDLIGTFDQSTPDDISDSHLQLLKERWQTVVSGDSKLLDRDEVKHLFGKREVS